MKTVISLLLTLLSFNAFGSGGSEEKEAMQTKLVKEEVTIAYFEGSVDVNGNPAELGMLLDDRAVISTGAASYCDIVFAGKNAIRVAQNTQTVLDFSGEAVDLTLEKGSVASVLRKLSTLADKDAYRIRTKDAVAGVRGTSFCVWTNDSMTYICACNGTIHTEDAKGSNDLVLTAAHHEARVYSLDGDGYSVVPEGLRFHTDKDVESLAARIGETIDWSRVE